ncbi:prolipoprotein diacylglyceryl transferase [Agrobacterium vitis]|uniref:prolipoprotein diacylglyceryl transferase n=1 Tax=Allorhizobium ampelinum TaxID=3025782 RepID=UPI001F1B1329|nr:prolipoprotein diacylglyceryl transferase [Allorhizobium ampelinum]MCF1463828.1 prolipoprotein diacylglyceryl transferase [Allorhizobium ampelinum]
MNTVASLFAILPYPQIDPIALSIGPIAIRWYGLAYVTGILIGWWLARRMIANLSLWPGNATPITEKHLDDFLVWAAIGIVLGGRIGYILFYDLQPVLDNPVVALEIWRGGMSFHGGLTGATLAMIVFARRNGLPVWMLFDLVACVAPIGLFFGRIANFINGELWGRISDVAWAMQFPTGGPFTRHPSQLYESALEGLVLFVLLQVLARRFHALKTSGVMSGVFICGYALARIFVEFFREPDEQLGYLVGGWLTMGMVLSLPMLALGLWAIWRARRAGRSQEPSGLKG